MTAGKSQSPSEAMEPLTWMELLISHVLRVGVLLSAAIILTGVLLFAVRQDTGYAKVLPRRLPELLSFHQANGPAYFPTSLAEVWKGALEGKPYGIICLGILLLIATPVVRVALSVIFFLVQGDWLYVGITLFVLAVLLVSMFAGIG
jgi:uncharacterized membrane protein